MTGGYQFIGGRYSGNSLLRIRVKFLQKISIATNNGGFALITGYSDRILEKLFSIAIDSLIIYLMIVPVAQM